MITAASLRRQVNGILVADVLWRILDDIDHDNVYVRKPKFTELNKNLKTFSLYAD